jgi:LPS O-antigen subunit length determinant protein (WzzB/FepE family)
MMDRPDNLNSNRDELDLLTMVEGAVSFFRNFGVTVIIFSFAGLLAGYLLYLVTPGKYASTLILHSQIVTNQEQLQIVKSWDELLQKREYNILAATFNCDPEIVKKVTEFSGEEIQQLYAPDNPNGFTVEVLVRDTGILDKLQQAIVYGLQNNEYTRERITSKKSNLNALIQKVATEISSLDSTKSNVENIINNKNQNKSSFIIDVTGINGQLIVLNEKLYAYESDLKFVSAVQVLKNFDKLKKPEKPKLSFSLIIGLVAGVFVGYLVALLRYVKQKLRKRADTSVSTAKNILL